MFLKELVKKNIGGKKLAVTHPNKIEKIKSSLKCYDDLVYTIARMEYARINGNYIIDFGELLAIGRVVINDLVVNSETEYNAAYISTAIRWAIRNELRRRYRWYSSKGDKRLRTESEKTYISILSINELQEQENPLQIMDTSVTPAQKCENDDLKILVIKSLQKLPPRERGILESRFFKDKSVKEISTEFAVSSSRVSRIIQAGIEKIKKDLQKQEAIY